MWPLQICCSVQELTSIQGLLHCLRIDGLHLSLRTTLIRARLQYINLFSWVKQVLAAEDSKNSGEQGETGAAYLKYEIDHLVFIATNQKHVLNALKGEMQSESSAIHKEEAGRAISRRR